MRRSLFILATLAMSSALYGQTDSGYYTREKVLELFAQYNPSVLEKATQNADYEAILEGFLSSYQGEENDQNRYELIAVARNFDNSIRLKGLTLQYEEATIFAQMSGNSSDSARLRFRKELLPVFQSIWAVTVQLRAYEIEELTKQLKKIQKDKSLSEDQRQARLADLKEKITVLKQEQKRLQKDPGEQILSAMDVYIAQADRNITAQLEALRAGQAQEAAQEVLQTDNLQIKTKNKKPVAK